MKNFKYKLAISIFVAALLSASTTKVNAQKGEIGFRFMPTVSSFNMKNSGGNTVQGSAVWGLGFGAFLGFNFTQYVGIQGEIMYNTLSQKYEDQNVQHKVNLKYVNIPVLLSLNTGKYKVINLNFVVGPQLGISAGSSLETTNGDGSNSSQPILSVKKNNVGFAYGAGVDFGLNKLHTFRLGLGFRGVYGLVDVSDNSKSTTTNSYYVLDRTHIKTYSGYAGISYLF